MNKWTTTKIISLGSLAALNLALSLLGSTIQTATGIPGSGGVFNALQGGIIVALCVLLIDRFWTLTIFGLIFSTLAIPFPIMGTPGFLPKILIGIGSGFIADIVYIALRKNPRIASFGTSGILQLGVLLFIVGIGTLFNIPGIDQTRELFLSPVLLSVLFVLSGGAGLIGYLIFRRLENTPAVLRIRGNQSE